MGFCSLGTENRTGFQGEPVQLHVGGFRSRSSSKRCGWVFTKEQAKAKQAFPYLLHSQIPNPNPCLSVSEDEACLEMASQLIREWVGIQQFPASTQTKLLDLLGKLKHENVSTLTVLVMGKGGVGKSSTVNSVVGERVVAVSAFQSEGPRPVMISRSRAGFTLNIVDTPGLIEGGYVNDQTLEIIKRFLLDRTIDVLLYVDRLDAYRVDNLDKQVIKAITDSFVGRRIKKQDAWGSSIPVVLVENSGRCSKNEGEEKILPDGTPWIPNLVKTITDVALNGSKGILVDKKLIEGPNPNRRWKEFIPLILAFQYFFIIKPIQGAIKSDIAKEARPSWELRDVGGASRKF
ncbi:hypothetical protein NL676_016246 [Syzygium grande]|nr:hypothetical protein NL676_016246 [Syzygium grande]